MSLFPGNHLKKLFIMSSVCILAGGLLTASDTSSSPFSKSKTALATSYLEDNISTKENIFHYKSKDYTCSSIPGGMVAAPFDKTSTLGNGYEYTWARDTAISMHTVASLYEKSIKADNSKDIQKYGLYLYNYITNWLTKTVFQTPADISMFYVDSKQAPRTFQADGPPARVRALTYMSELFIQHPKTIKISEDKTVDLNKEFVIKNIFNPKTPKTDLIGYELKYITKNWNKITVGLWEMSHGHHYYTQMLDLIALIKSAALAKQLGYKQWPNKCLEQAYNIVVNLKSFYQKWQYYGEKHNLPKPQISMKIITELKDAKEKPIKNLDKWYEKYQRAAGLNISVVLGSLYGNIFDDLQEGSETYNLLKSNKFYKKIRKEINSFNVFPYSNEMIQTAYYLLNANVAKDVNPPYSQGIDVYAINSKKNFENGFGPFIGRYPSDHYTGFSWSDINKKANPWFISTVGMARYYYNLAYEYKVLGTITIPVKKSSTPEVINFFKQATRNKDLKPGTYKKGSKEFNEIISGLINSGNAIVKSANLIAEKYDMHMSEQIDRDTGKEASFPNLSWSYSSYIDTESDYNKAVK